MQCAPALPDAGRRCSRRLFRRSQRKARCFGARGSQRAEGCSSSSAPGSPLGGGHTRAAPSRAQVVDPVCCSQAGPAGLQLTARRVFRRHAAVEDGSISDGSTWPVDLVQTRSKAQDPRTAPRTLRVERSTEDLLPPPQAERPPTHSGRVHLVPQIAHVNKPALPGALTRSRLPINHAAIASPWRPTLRLGHRVMTSSG